jgi:hypothetical protein
VSGLQEPGEGGMERRAIVATVLALIVLIVYQTYFAPTPPSTPRRHHGRTPRSRNPPLRPRSLGPPPPQPRHRSLGSRPPAL